MSEQFKLDGHGRCPTCQKDSVQGEHIECRECNELFHAICSSAGPDDKVATKTTITNFLLPSTKQNFHFYCDVCLTNIEIRKTESSNERITNLEDKMLGIDKQLEEIKKLLSGKGRTNTMVQGEDAPPKDNLWNNKERLEKVRAPEPKARLIISKDTDERKNKEARKVIEKVLIENEISLAETHQNKDGDLVLICDSKDAREELKQLVQTASQEIVMSSPNTKLDAITIVGLLSEYGKEEVVKCIKTQNGFVKQFATLNKLDDHLKIHVIKPLKNNPNTFQVFASVSPVLRDGLRHHKDRIIIGVVSCKIYDRQQVLRCNNCQHFGHFAKQCPTPEEPFCAKCSGNHRTDSCTGNDRKCINCMRKNETDVNHSVYYHGCPSTAKYLELKASSLNQGQTHQHQT